MVQNRPGKQGGAVPIWYDKRDSEEENFSGQMTREVRTGKKTGCQRDTWRREMGANQGIVIGASSESIHAIQQAQALGL